MCWIQQFSGWARLPDLTPTKIVYDLGWGIGYGSLAYTCELTTYRIAARTIIKAICKPFQAGDSTADFKIHQTSAETPRRDCSSSKLQARLKLNNYKYICKHVSNIYNN